jgi:hypothetical protein
MTTDNRPVLLGWPDRAAPDLPICSPSELRVLAAVKEVFQNFGAKKLSDISQNEVGHREIETSRLISYDYASELSFDI